MSRLVRPRYRLFAGGLVLTLGLVGLAGSAGHAQVALQPKPLPSQAVLKKIEQNSKQPYKTVPSIPPGALTASLNDQVLRYAESKLGQQVGRGECWDLANEALKAAGARQPDQGGYGSYVFGQAVALTALKPGDILQFENVAFKHTYPDGKWYTDNFPHHTAVVRKVTGRQIELLHQNVNGDRRVQTGTINLDHRQAGGTLVAYRPQPR